MPVGAFRPVLIGIAILFLAACAQPCSCQEGGGGGGGGSDSAASAQPASTLPYRAYVPLSPNAEHGKPRPAYREEVGLLQYLHMDQGSIDCGIDGNC